MRLDDLPPELLQYCVYSGYLTAMDAKNLAFVNGTLFEKLLGDEYARDRFRAICGLVECTRNGFTNGAKIALQTQDPTVDNHLPMVIAAKHGRDEIIRMMIKWRGHDGKQANPMISAYLIAEAVSGNHIETVKVLLDWIEEWRAHGLNLRLKFSIAEKHKRTEIFKLLKAAESRWLQLDE